MNFENKSFSKYTKLAVCILLASFCGIYFRMYPAVQNLDRINTSLYRQLALTNITMSLKNSLTAQYPSMPENIKIKLVLDKITDISRNEKNKIDDIVIKMRGNRVKTPFEFYLLGADSYYYYYLTKKILDTGAISSKIVNGKYFEPLMLAPNGNWRIQEIHPYIGAGLFRTLGFFRVKAPLYKILAVYPLILLPISILLFFIVCKKLDLSILTSFVGSIFFILAPIYLERSSYGWYDTDPYNVIFILGSLLSFFILLEKNKTKRALPALSALALISGVYSLFWYGWILIPSLVVASLTVYILHSLLTKRFSLHLIGCVLYYIFLTAAFASVCLSPKGLLTSLLETREIFSGFLFLRPNPWPDIFLTVGELKHPTFIKIKELLGSPVFFIISSASIYLALPTKQKRKTRPQEITLIVFFIILIAMAKSAQRFVIFLLPVTAVCFTLTLDRLLSSISDVSCRIIKASGKINLRKMIYSGSIILIILPFIYGNKSASGQNPLFNQAWNDTLTYIRDNTPKNSIINSWWPPGHFIKAIAERPVTFDGATMNTPQAYWMSVFFLSQNENDALGILRMINSSGNDAVEYLIDRGVPLDSAVKIIKTITKLPKRSALQFLSGKIHPKQINELLSLTHGDTPPAYCYIYNDLVENILGLYYVENWDFSKALRFENDRERNLKKKTIFRRGSKENVSDMWALSGGMPYIGKESPVSKKEDDILYFENGVIFNQKTKTTLIENLENKISGTPVSIVYADDTGVPVHKDLSRSTLKLSVLFIGEPGNIKSCIVAPPKIISSLLFRLYYFKGKGLKHFSLFTEAFTPFVNTRILVFKVDVKGSGE